MYPRENSFTRRQANFNTNNNSHNNTTNKYPPNTQDMRFPEDSPVAVRQTRRQNFEGPDYYDPHTPPRHDYGPPSRNRDPRYDSPSQLGGYPRQYGYHPGQDFCYPTDPRYNPDPRAAQPRNYPPNGGNMYPPYPDADYQPHMPFHDSRSRWAMEDGPVNVTPNKNFSPPGVAHGSGGRGPTNAGSEGHIVAGAVGQGLGQRAGSDGVRGISAGTKYSNVTDKSSMQSEGKAIQAERRKKLDPKIFTLSMELLGNAGNGRLDMCQQKIANGANADFADYDKRTPLHVASANGHVLIVKLLLDCGANPDVEDRWGSKPVDDANKNGHKEIIDLLRDHGGHHEDTLHKEQHDGLELLEYCSKGLIKLVRDKIRAGTKATFSSYDRRTPLHLACCEGHMDMVRLLLQNGADATYLDRFGRSPVDDALSNGHVDVLRLLASKGITVPEHILDEDHTPEFQLNMHLIDFAAKGKAGAVHKCLHEGAEVNFVDYDKRTALHLASENGHAKVVSLLLSEGADPTIEDRFGHTTMEVTENAGHTNITEIIKEFMRSAKKSSQ